MPEKNWSRISAIWTVVGVIVTSIIGLAGLLLMWWIYRNPKPEPGGIVPIGWWMPVLIGGTIIASGLLHFIAVRGTKATSDVPPALTVHRAEWGKGPHSGDYEDVTEIVSGRIRGNNLTLRASDENLGALFPGHPKHLKVWYSLGNGAKQLITVAHNDVLRLPDDMLDPLSATPEALGRMSANTSAMYHWKGLAEGNAEELKHAHESYRQLSEIATSKIDEQTATIAKNERKIHFLDSQEYRQFWTWYGRVQEQADIADKLNALLEVVWHLWNNSGEKLIHPLHSGTILEAPAPLPWNQRQLLEFRILYRHHIVDVQTIDSEFHSNLIDDGFPCDGIGQEYLLVRRKVEAHAGLLRDHASLKFREFCASKEEL